MEGYKNLPSTSAEIIQALVFTAVSMFCKATIPTTVTREDVVGFLVLPLN